MAEIKIRDIQIENLEGVFQSIEELEVHIKPGVHGCARIKGIASDNCRSILASFSDKKEVTISSVSGEIIFDGFLKEHSIEKENEYEEVTFSLITSSYFWDIEKRRRSFQDISKMYGDIIIDVKDNYSDGEIILSGLKDKNTNKTILQYGETDFEFIKRMASECNTKVFASGKNITEVLSIGFPPKTKNYIFDGHKFIKGISPVFRDINGDMQGLSMYDYSFYQFECKENLHIGDMVRIDGMLFKIIEKDVNLEDAVLKYTYTVGTDCLLECISENNYISTGLSLEGNVANVDATTITTNLDIDSMYKSQSLVDMPWKTISSNLLYAMPDQGSRVKVLWDAVSDTGFVASTNIRTNGSTCANTSEPVKKIFQYPADNMMVLGNDNLKIACTNQNIEILNDGYVSFYSDITVRINGNKKINLKGLNISFDALSVLNFVSDLGGSTNIDTTIDVDGSSVNSNAKERKAFPQIQDAPVEIEMTKNIWKAITKAIVATIIAAAVCLVVAALVVSAAATAGATLALGSVFLGLFLSTLGGALVYGAIATAMDGGGWYTFLDQYSNGALLFSVAGLGEINPALLLIGTGIMSFGYQLLDMGLDAIFGHDYDDKNITVKDFLFNSLEDVLFTYLGGKMGEYFEKKIASRYLKKLATVLRRDYPNIFNEYMKIVERLNANGRNIVKAETINVGKNAKKPGVREDKVHKYIKKLLDEMGKSDVSQKVIKDVLKAIYGEYSDLAIETGSGVITSSDEYIINKLRDLLFGDSSEDVSFYFDDNGCLQFD